MNQTYKIYYKSRLAIVRESEIADAFVLAENLRESDKREIWRSDHKTPEQALVEGFTNSIACWTVERNEAPIAMFGVVPNSILGSTATIWLLASPELLKVQKAFIKHSRYFIDMMLEFYPVLINWVDCDNRESIKWLKFCGAQMSLAMPYGIEGKPFMHFSLFRRK